MQRKTVVSSLQAACLLCILTSTLMASDPLDTWTWRNALPNGNNINAVTYANGLIVGVGNWGTIMTSTNLAADRWVQSPNGTNTSTLNAITYGNGMFLVGAGDSPDGDKTKRFLTSTDGTNWSTQTWTNGNTRSVKCLAYGTGLFVAGCERAEIWTSPNGTNWTQRYTGGNSKHNFNGVTYRPDVGFVAVGDAAADNAGLPEVRTSPDGVTWSLQQTVGLPSLTFAAITWGWVTNGDLTVTTNFVATGTTGTIATSPDGTNWTTHPSYTTVKLYGTAFNPGVGYIAVGVGGVIQTSPDGTNWYSSYSDLSQPGNDFAAATYASDLGYFIGVGSSGMVETSPDGSPGSWSAKFLGRPENLTGVARGSNNFVVVGNTLPFSPFNAVVLTSSSGSSWKVRTSSSTTKLNNVAYGAGTFVAVGNSGKIVTSTDDGVNWAVQASGVVAHLYGVSYITNSVTNMFIATGATGTLLTSPDGITWTPQTSGVTSSLYSSAYGAGTYLAVGASGVIRSSPDGTTWSTVTSPTTKDFNGILYNAANSTNNFIVVGANGGIYTSPNGINWTARPTVYGTGSSASFSSIAYGSGRFVVGASPAPGILVSTNGVDWATQLSPSSSAFKAIAWAPDTFVGVGSGGSIVQAGAIAVARPQIHYSYAGGTLTLTWSGGGTLQASSPDVSGTYTNVSGAVSPYAVTPLSEPSMYFRVQQP
ncbi:MAG: hypothetical protein WCL11_22295 [Verrucomicrobiota bacterium]